MAGFLLEYKTNRKLLSNELITEERPPVLKSLTTQIHVAIDSLKLLVQDFKKII